MSSNPVSHTAKPQRARVLVVDDDPNTLASLSRAFRLAGHEVTVCDSADRALAVLQSHSFDLIFSDVVMPGKDGLTFLEEFRASGAVTPVVMISGQAHVQMAVRATKLGALDFLEKPLSTDKLLLTVSNALRVRQLERENQELRQRVGKNELVFTGEAMCRIMEQVKRVAATETRVCILGETGTGKELIARTIHDLSNRRTGPFITLNCAAVPSELVETELFGHEKGAFTGAAGRHLGKFEQANNGTLFLDEIGDMPAQMQAKLLRVLEQNEIERVGGDCSIPVNVRVVVATHRRLEDLVKEGKFRQDLYHRIYVFPVLLPPLRERRADIPALIDHFSRQITDQNGWKPVVISDDAKRHLQDRPWPGNVRELRNALERLVIFALDNKVDASTVVSVLGGSPTTPSTSTSSPQLGSLSERVAAYERECIVQELEREHHHITNTAKALGLERSHLYKKCQQLGIDLRALRNA